MMMFLWRPFLLLMPFAIFWMVRPGTGVGGCGMTHAGQAETPSRGVPDPMDIARMRLARGEITPAEFEVVRRVIG
jgi:uncharacterized membrane protein